ncbi:hypothetical protein Tco_0289648 [Tanacetum coccineum]
MNAEVRGEPIPTLPFVTSSVSATPGREGGDHTDSVCEPNFCTIGASQRFVISSDSSHYSGTNIVEVDVDSLISSSAPGINDVCFSTHQSRLDDGRVCREMVDEFAPPKFFASIRGMEHDQLFTEFNVGAARQMSLSAEVRMCAEYNIREKRRSKFVAEERAELLKVKEKEVEDLKAQLLLKEAEAVEAIRLRAEASKFEAVEKSLQDEVKALKVRNASLEKEWDALDVKVTGLEASAMGKDRELTDFNAHLTSVKSHNDSLVDQVHELEDAQLKIVNDKFDKMYANFVETALHLEEKFYHRPDATNIIISYFY